MNINEKITDKIFLLSIEEYKRYKSAIPAIGFWWWLRSPGDYSDCAAYVNYNGSIYSLGYYVNYFHVAVRPALRIGNLESSNLKVGERVEECGRTWIVIDVDEGLAIAEKPIALRRFDPEKNDYESSEVRQFLLLWLQRHRADKQDHDQMKRAEEIAKEVSKRAMSEEGFLEELTKLLQLKPLCNECESRDCAYNNDGMCRYAMVHDQVPEITEEDGCKAFVIPLPEGTF